MGLFWERRLVVILLRELSYRVVSLYIQPFL